MTFPSARITAVLAAIAIMVATAAGSGPPTSAQTDPIVSVDAVSDAANTATTVGTVDTCLSTTTGATFDADVVIQGVTNISGFQADLLYDPNVLKVTAVDYNFLLASTGASVLPLGNSTPDTDGDFFMAAAMFSLISITGADGDGVLTRVTFQAVGSGFSHLDLTNVKLSDADGNPIPPTDANNFYAGPVNDAFVAVDSSCADGDGDGVPDDSDNCPSIANGPNEAGSPGVGNQTNTDAANEAAGFLFNGAPLPGDPHGDACDADDDNDGFSDADERAIYQVSAGSAQELTPCRTDTVDDPWPPDTYEDQLVDGQDLVAFLPALFKGFGEGGYSARLDIFEPGTVIDGQDLVVVLPFLFQSCEPPP